MGEKTKEPERFVDLVGELSEVELERRRKIEGQIAGPVQGIEELVESWHGMRVDLGEGASLVGRVGLMGEQRGEKKYLFGTRLFVGENERLSLTFAGKSSGREAGSLVALYNTKVKMVRRGGESVFGYYDAMMYLLGRMVPCKTKLSLYVRQWQSRQMLDGGADPEETPLVKVFGRAGWRLGGYALRRFEKNELKRHRLVLWSGGSG